jgi:hypothetical protein
MNDNPTPSPLPPWSDIQSNIATNGMPAYLSALKTVYDAVSRLIETTAPNPSNPKLSPPRSDLPGSIPESGVIHMPAATSGPYCLVTLEEYAEFVRAQNSLACLLSGE